METNIINKRTQSGGVNQRVRQLPRGTWMDDISNRDLSLDIMNNYCRDVDSEKEIETNSTV